MSRRPNHSGCIVQRSDGRWQASLQVEGRRVALTAKTKQEVTTKLQALQRQALTQGGLPEAGHTLGNLLDQWLATGDWRPRTVADYQRIARVVRQGLGDCPLTKLTPSRIQAFYATLRNSPRKALYCHQTLHAACKLAVQWGWLPVNPADRVARPGYHKKEKELWTDDQCRQFLKATQDSPWWPLWTVALTTGCRYGELIALRWLDVDTERQTVKVERSLQRINREWVETTPKTPSGRRTIHLGALALRALQRQKAQAAEWRLKAGSRWQDTGRIFTARQGGHLELSGPYHALLDACRALGLPVVSMHCLRHLNASLALQAGAPVALVSRQLGHANVGITTTIYSHALSDGRAVADALEKVLRL